MILISNAFLTQLEGTSVVAVEAEDEALATSLGEGPLTGVATGAAEEGSGDTEKPVVVGLTFCVKAVRPGLTQHPQWRRQCVGVKCDSDRVLLKCFLQCTLVPCFWQPICQSDECVVFTTGKLTKLETLFLQLYHKIVVLPCTSQILNSK